MLTSVSAPFELAARLMALEEVAMIVAMSVAMLKCIFLFVFWKKLKTPKRHFEIKSSFLPKSEQKIVRISALTTQGRNSDNFLFRFWEKG